MGRMSPHAPVSSASGRRLARWLVSSPIRDVERDLVLETLANTHGNRTASARLLGVSVRTLRNKIAEYLAEGMTCLVTRARRANVEYRCRVPGLLHRRPLG
jgi:DNA-binding NtrC family response regulator